MAQSFHLDVITPERQVVSVPVEFVTLPTVEGFYGILAGHAPMVGSLKAGVVHYRHGGASRVLAVTGGFFEAGPHATVVLADEAELPEEIDVATAIAERDRARAIIEAGGEQEEIVAAKEALERAMARLRAAGKE